MFGADFHVYKHTAGREIIRTLSYSVPSHLKGHVELMYPGISCVFSFFRSLMCADEVSSFPSGSNQKVVLSAPIKAEAESHGLVSDAGNAIPSSCARSVTPACLQAQYGIPTTAATQKTNAIGVSGYDEQYANKKDLTSFLTKYRPDMSSATTFTLQTIDGGSNSQTLSQAGVEADLDIQYTVGIATGVPTYFISGELAGGLFASNRVLPAIQSASRTRTATLRASSTRSTSSSASRHLPRSLPPATARTRTMSRAL
jgi:tripeptidyl-peptidase-1